MANLYFYKKEKSDKWKGPGKVIGTDSQDILVKHGSSYVWLHRLEIMSVSDSETKDQVNTAIYKEDSDLQTVKELAKFPKLSSFQGASTPPLKSTVLFKPRGCD